MKKTILTAFYSFCFVLSMFAQGIVFFNGTYEEIKTKATQEDKKIFVDVYTSWCGPCKQMDINVFTDIKVGNYFNSHFISVKLDAEKESTHGFFNDYKANAYPSFFWLDGEGKLLDQHSGMVDSEDFIKMGQKALKGDLGQQQELLKQRWEAGERSLELLQKYIFDVVGKQNPSAIRPEVIDFFNNLNEEELLSYPIYKIVLSMAFPRSGIVNDRILELLRTNFDYYEQYYANKYDTSIQGFYSILYRNIVRVNTAQFLNAKKGEEVDKILEQQIDFIKLFQFKYETMYIQCIKAEKLLYSGDFTDGINAIDTILKEYGSDYPYIYEQLLYSLTLSNYFNKGNKLNIETLLKITEQAMTVIPNKAIVTYYAAAQMTAGNYHEAISALANKHFYSGSDISNAMHKHLNFSNIRHLFPERKFPEKKITE